MVNGEPTGKPPNFSGWIPKYFLFAAVSGPTNPTTRSYKQKVML